MKKIIVLFLTIVNIFTLSACSGGFGNSIHEDLQSTNWNVVSTKGDAYRADFGEDTVTFDFSGFSFGYSYSLNEDENKITFKPSEDDEVIEYNIERKEDEFILKAATEEVREEDGDLTLTPTDTE